MPYQDESLPRVEKDGRPAAQRRSCLSYDFQEESIACRDHTKVANPSNNGINPNPCGGLMDNHPFFRKRLRYGFAYPVLSFFFPQVPCKIGALVILLVLFPDLTGLDQKGSIGPLYSTEQDSDG